MRHPEHKPGTRIRSRKCISRRISPDFQSPIGCKVRRTAKLHFRIKQRNGRDGEEASAFEYCSPEEMLGFDDPASEAAVIKACIELVGIRDFSKAVSENYSSIRQNVRIISIFNSQIKMLSQ